MEKTKKTIITTSNLSGTHDYKMAHIRYLSQNAITEVENGGMVVLGDYLLGNREVRKATAPAAITDANIYILAGDLLDKRQYEPKGISDMVNQQDGDTSEPIRAYYANPVGQFALSAQGFVGTPAITEGKFATLTAGSTKLAIVEAPPTDGSFYCQVVGIDPKIEGQAMYRLEIKANPTVKIAP